MRSSERCAAAIAVAVLAWASRADAQQQAQGFAVERLYLSAPGAGWIVMDTLDTRGEFGGVMAVAAGYSRDALRVTDEAQHLAVVSDQAFADFGFAITYDRWRAYADFGVPLAITGQSGTVGGWRFAAPSVDPGSRPDTMYDPRVGLDVRLVGGHASAFRLGLGAQVYAPNGSRADYDTDGTFRAMARVLFAGDVASIAYAGHVGAHVRPLDDSPAPGSPRGNELLFGVAAGPRVRVGSGAAVVVGPEIFGETALASPLDPGATGVEALVSGRYEATGDAWPQTRVKIGAGGGIDAHFGAPEWRAVVALEMFDRNPASP